MSDLPLAAAFPAATRDRWLERVAGVLKGGDFDKKLVAQSRDGIRIEPLYGKADGTTPLAGAEPGPWRIAQRVDHPDPAAANALALADLEGGADGLTLVLAGAPSARGFGMKIRTVDDLDRALGDVMLDLVHVRLDAGGSGRQAAALLVALAERRGLALDTLSVDLGLDPIGALAAAGRLSASWDTVATRMADTLSDLTERGFAGRAFLADGRPYHEAGASEAQELAAALATALAVLRALEAGGHGLDAARDALAFLMVADADEFLTVAKFRALRRLWARIEEACGLAPKPLRLHAETAWRMTTRCDPWVNMLRATVAVFSAGIGGADAVTVLPFTAALGLPDAFARRIARNTQLILIEESNLARVADPAAGAGGFEALTDALCHEAWERFREIEREGGIVKSLASGALQARIAAVRAGREAAVATRRDPITGTSEFPDIREAPVAVLMPSPLPASAETPPSAPAPDGGAGGDRAMPFRESVARAAAGTSLADLAAGTAGPEPIMVAPLPSVRVAEPFERLRDRSDAFLARTGARPRVFLANLGPIAAFTPRATFAKNFFEAGGIEALANDGFPSVSEIALQYRTSGAELCCICSSDEIYHQLAISAAVALREAGCRFIYVAGRPDSLQEARERVGPISSIFAGCDAVRTLDEALVRAGA